MISNEEKLQANKYPLSNCSNQSISRLTGSHSPTIPVLQGQREDCEYKVSLGPTLRTRLKTKRKITFSHPSGILGPFLWLRSIYSHKEDNSLTCGSDLKEKLHRDKLVIYFQH